MDKLKVTKEQVKHVGMLARLEIKDNEVGAFQDHLQKILDYSLELDQVDTSGINPLFSPVYEHLDVYTKTNYLREDSIKESLTSDEILKNAPQQSQNQFKLEAVIEEE
jgi:aspartyl-tRNA(Asn)/glutamyl-tRNA(Gln) amidotransferase subunit C